MNNPGGNHFPDLLTNNGKSPQHHQSSSSPQLLQQYHTANSPVVDSSATSGPHQQKRQNSLSNYMISNSNKRSQTPLQSENSNNITLTGSISNNNISNNINSTGNTMQPMNFNNPNNQASPRYSTALRSGVRRSTYNHPMKTPTPSTYEVPSSPGVNPMSSASAQNHSDSSDSNPVDPEHPGHQNPNLVSAKDSTASTPTNTVHLKQPLVAPAAAIQQRTMSDEEQQLASKLKETYKNVVNYEEIVQKNCIDITYKINHITHNNHNTNMVYGNSPLAVNQSLSSSVNSQSSINSPSSRTSELSNDLWTVYHHNIILLDNYYDFLVTALKPSSNQTQFKTGKNIVELYKIPRRMWVYGIVGFLEVLKNIMSIFQDHEICSCFISYCFNIISNLTDSILEMEGWWSEKLGDLSRMAIALYSSKFIDWKVSAEYWYSVAMKTLYGHGKIYYHMCTVQQDNLDALVNIGKSVVCRDPFVPTQHYLKLVVENICTQRNILSLLELPIIDFIKIHKVLLSIFNRNNESISKSVEGIHDSQVQYGIDLVTRYGLTFGSDSNGYNFFTRELYTPSGVTTINDPHHPYELQQHQQQQPSASNTIEKMNFWLNKGPLFAISNINHLIGFGDPKNPFAKMFLLPEALKERKDKKDRKRKSRTSQSHLDEQSLPGRNPSIGSANGAESSSIPASDLSVKDWFYGLQFINKSVLELSIRILNHYLIGPKQASTSHVIVWLYFLISLGEASNKFPNSAPMVNWLFKKLFPWESLINYLNSLLQFVRHNPNLSNLCNKYLIKHPNYLDYFNKSEFLPEVWKCWGTLWFDQIVEKGDFTDLDAAGVKNSNLFDLPICGTYPIVLNNDKNARTKNQMENDNDERVIRIILLARIVADQYNFGLYRDETEFKYDQNTYSSNDASISPDSHNDPYMYMEEFLLSDGRFIQNNFLQPISVHNLGDINNQKATPAEIDEEWFVGMKNETKRKNGNYDDMIEDDENDIDLDIDQGHEELAPFVESEFDDEEAALDSQHQQSLQNHHLYHQFRHQQALEQAQQLTGSEPGGFYNENFIGGSMDSTGANAIKGNEMGAGISLQGDLGDRMDSSITHITLDTNIWLKHCGRIYKCVRNGVFKVSIPLIVFQELRALRKSAEVTISDAATRSVIIVRELYLTKEILPLRYDGTVASDINETLEFENNSNWRACVDETILNAVNEHDDIGKKLMKGTNMQITTPTSRYVLDSTTAKMFRYCILITDDRNMRLRAKSIGLTSFQSKWLFAQVESIFPYKCYD